MKAQPVMDPAAAFPDPEQPPDDAALLAALGPAAPAIATVLADLRLAEPAVTADWQFSPRAGWYQLQMVKKRRLLYLVPQKGDFRVSLILGRKATAGMKDGPFAKQTAKLLKTARHYPEGIAFSFNRRTLDPDVLTALLAAKRAT